MTKAAAVRSILRKRALTKAAALYESHSLGGMPSSYKPGIVQNGWQASINDMVSKRQPPLAPRQPASAQTPAAPRQSSIIPADGYYKRYYGALFRPVTQPFSNAADWMGQQASRAAGAAWRGIEWGAGWPDHVKGWWNRNFGRQGNGK